jgi:hypothetical protein
MSENSDIISECRIVFTMLCEVGLVCYKVAYIGSIEIPNQIFRKHTKKI